jgi:ribosomal protein L13
MGKACDLGSHTGFCRTGSIPVTHMNTSNEYNFMNTTKLYNYQQFKSLKVFPRCVQIDCSNMVVGNACSLISKALSLDKRMLVDVINLNALSVKTDPTVFQKKILARWAAGSPKTGPFKTKGFRPYFFRIMKGMLNMHKSHGVQMWKRIRIKNTVEPGHRLCTTELLIGHNIHNLKELVERL